MNDKKHLGMFLDSQMHYKLCYIAQYEDRSLRREIQYILRCGIRAYEKKHGPIPLPETPSIEKGGV